MTAWVLLRGLARESRHWGPFPVTLAGALAGAVGGAAGDGPIITLDLPGTGQTNHLRSPLSVQAIAEQCRTELRARSVNPPHRLLGLSLGGMVATAWAGMAPREVDRMVLINTSMRPFSRFHERLRPRNYARLLRLALLPHGDRAAEELVLAMTSRRGAEAAPGGTGDVIADVVDDVMTDVLAQWVAVRRSAPVSRANALRQLIAAMRFTAPRAAPIPNVLLLTSANDALVSTHCSQQLAQAWQCGVASHPTAGHDLPLDDAPWVARQVAAWLVRVDQGQAG